MQLIYFFALIFVGWIGESNNLTVKSKMSLRDRNICMACLENINKLAKLQNSSACEGRGMDLMCYEVYYYFYYFQPDFFFQPSGENLNFQTKFEMKNKK